MKVVVLIESEDEVSVVPSHPMSLGGVEILRLLSKAQASVLKVMNDQVVLAELGQELKLAQEGRKHEDATRAPD